MRRGLGNPRTSLNIPTTKSQGCQKEKRKTKKLKAYLKKIMKENLPNLAKEQTSRKSRKLRVPKKLDPRRNTPRHIIITLAKIKETERILKAAREKETVTYKGFPIRLSAAFSKETLQARRGWKEVFQVMKGKDLHPRLPYPTKLSFRMERQIKVLPRQGKAKGVHHQAIVI